jgi:hypothetical protein
MGTISTANEPAFDEHEIERGPDKKWHILPFSSKLADNAVYF